MAKKKKAQVRNPWSQDELKKLKKIFRNRSTQQVADELGRTLKSVEGKATKLGLTKTKAYLKSLGRKS